MVPMTLGQQPRSSAGAHLRLAAKHALKAACEARRDISIVVNERKARIGRRLLAEAQRKLNDARG
jgi:hypothetical protein